MMKFGGDFVETKKISKIQHPYANQNQVGPLILSKGVLNPLKWPYKLPLTWLLETPKTLEEKIYPAEITGILDFLGPPCRLEIGAGVGPYAELLDAAEVISVHIQTNL